MNTFYEHHQDSIRFAYCCFDRILLHGLIQPFQQPERVVGFFGTSRRQYPVTRDLLRDIATQFHSWVKNRAQRWDVPIVDGPARGLDKFVEPYFLHAKPDHVVPILKAREPARLLIAIGKKPESRWHLQFAQRWVIRCNFYLNDRDWRRIFVCVCPSFRFSARLGLNQHQWLATQLRAKGIPFRLPGPAPVVGWISVPAVWAAEGVADAWGQLWHCAACGHQTSVTARTIFQDTRTPLPTGFRAMCCVTRQKTGVRVLGLQGVLALGGYKTAWTWLPKLRRAMVRRGVTELHRNDAVEPGSLVHTDSWPSYEPLRRLGSSGRRSHPRSSCRTSIKSLLSSSGGCSARIRAPSRWSTSTTTSMSSRFGSTAARAAAASSPIVWSSRRGRRPGSIRIARQVRPISFMTGDHSILGSLESSK